MEFESSLEPTSLVLDCALFKEGNEVDKLLFCVALLGLHSQVSLDLVTDCKVVKDEIIEDFLEDRPLFEFE